MERQEAELEADRFLWIMARLMVGHTEREALTLSKGETGVLMALYEHEDGLSSGTMGEILGICPGGVANLFKGLEAKGLITREIDAHDKRSNHVTLTEKGRTSIRARYVHIRDEIVEVIDQLGLTKTHQFNDILEEILEIHQAS